MKLNLTASFIYFQMTQLHWFPSWNVSISWKSLLEFHATLLLQKAAGAIPKNENSHGEHTKKPCKQSWRNVYNHRFLELEFTKCLHLVLCVWQSQQQDVSYEIDSLDLGPRGPFCLILRTPGFRLSGASTGSNANEMSHQKDSEEISIWMSGCPICGLRYRVLHLVMASGQHCSEQLKLFQGSVNAWGGPWLKDLWKRQHERSCCSRRGITNGKSNANRDRIS